MLHRESGSPWVICLMVEIAKLKDRCAAEIEGTSADDMLGSPAEDSAAFSSLPHAVPMHLPHHSPLISRWLKLQNSCSKLDSKPGLRGCCSGMMPAGAALIFADTALFGGAKTARRAVLQSGWK